MAEIPRSNDGRGQSGPAFERGHQPGQPFGVQAARGFLQRVQVVQTVRGPVEMELDVALLMPELDVTVLHGIARLQAVRELIGQRELPRFPRHGETRDQVLNQGAVPACSGLFPPLLLDKPLHPVPGQQGTHPGQPGNGSQGSKGA